MADDYQYFCDLGIEVPVAFILSHYTNLGILGIWVGYPAAFVVSLSRNTDITGLYGRKTDYPADSIRFYRTSLSVYTGDVFLEKENEFRKWNSIHARKQGKGRCL